MRAIADRPVRFGELAGDLVHGSVFFDWQLVSTQALASAVDYSLQEILANGGIPYAPVSVRTSVDRYPRFEDSVSVDVTPTDVGDHRVVLDYAVSDGTGPLGSARIVHVSIAPDGGAAPLPDDARDRLAGMVDESGAVDPRTPTPASDGSPLASFERTFTVRSPHVEGAELAYFEEYPRFASVALEEFLEERGLTLGSLDDNPFRLRAWEWSFEAPVRFETDLTVRGEIREVTDDRALVAHEFREGDRLLIEGLTEYGCFDGEGRPTAFPPAVRERLGG